MKYSPPQSSSPTPSLDDEPCSELKQQQPQQKHRKLPVEKQKVPCVKGRGNHPSKFAAKAGKRVRFASSVTLATWQEKSSRDEIRLRWYQPSDFQLFNQDCVKTVMAIRGVNGDLTHLNPHEFCVVGLEEQLTNKQVAERRLRTTRFLQTILEHQYWQRYSGTCDPEKFRPWRGRCLPRPVNELICEPLVGHLLSNLASSGCSTHITKTSSPSIETDTITNEKKDREREIQHINRELNVEIKIRV